MELLPTPIAYPGVCYITKVSGPVVDTGVDIEWFPANAVRPRLYLSVDLIREMADIAGVREQSTAERMNETAIYNRGYVDAVKEHAGGQFVDLVDRLGLLTSLLGGSDRNGDLVREDLALDSGEPAVEDDGQPGPSNGTRRQRRRADVPGNPAA